MNQYPLSHITKLEKFFTLFLLTIPLFLMATYQPIDSTFLNLFNLKLWQGSTLSYSFQNISKEIDQKIEDIKVETNEESLRKQCSRFTKLKETQESLQKNTLFNSGQFCDQLIDRYFQQIFLTIIFQKQQGNLSKFKSTKFQQRIKAKTGLEVKIIQQILDTSILPQQVKDKLNDSFYINTMALEYSNMKYLKHCRYSNKRCQNLLVVISEWDIIKNGFYQVGEVIFSHPSSYQLTILQILTQGVMSLSTWNNVIRIRNLQSLKKEIANVQNLQNNFMIQLKQPSFTQNIKLINKYLNNGKQLPPSLLSSGETVRADLFPSEYKLGIYLPIILIMIIFPCFNVLKI